MFEGFIPGSRASFILDFIGVAMIILLAILTYSVKQVRDHKNYALHKKLQITVSSILAVAVLAFEIDMKISGWKHLAEPSPFYDSYVFPALFVHICCSVSAIVSWVVLVYNALKKFPKPLTTPGAHGNFHRKWGKFGFYAMYATTITGAIFYWLAFVAI